MGAEWRNKNRLIKQLATKKGPKQKGKMKLNEKKKQMHQERRTLSSWRSQLSKRKRNRIERQKVWPNFLSRNRSNTELIMVDSKEREKQSQQ